MKRFLFFAFLLLPLTASAQPAELIVRVAPNAPGLEQALQGQKSAQDNIAELFEGVKFTRPVFARGAAKSNSSAIPAYVITAEDSTSLARLRTAWQSAPGVRYVQENSDFTVYAGDRLSAASPIPFRPENREGQRLTPPSSPPNAFADSLDHLDVTRARQAQAISEGVPSVRIGIIDTGVDLAHPDLATQYATNPAEDLNGNGRFDAADLNGVDDDGNGYVDDVAGYDFVDRPGLERIGEYVDRDPDARPDTTGFITGHGTFVAGIISGRPANPERGGVLGVAPGARYVPLRAFGADGRGQTDDIAAAIVYAADLGLEVVNLSFGRDRPAPLIEEAVRYANDRGVTIVASAGNQATDDAHYPSDYPDVISVMWLAEDGDGLPEGLSQSQYGIGVDIGAPGTAVFTTRYPGPVSERDTVEISDLYGPVNGSSFAAPQVAGAAALLLSVDPTLDPTGIRSILTDTATDLQQQGWDHVTAAGLLDVLRALQQSTPSAVEITAPEFNGGLRGDASVVITGSAVNPGFESYSLLFARGTRDFEERFDPWEPITSQPIEVPVLQDTLATWDVAALSPSSYPDGEYTLRLVVQKRDGTTAEDRRRVYIDRTPPQISVRSAFGGLVDGEYGAILDVATDDVTQVQMEMTLNGRMVTTTSEYEVRRHGLRVVDPTGQGGTATIALTATNPAGRSTTETLDLDIPARSFNTALFSRTPTTLTPGRVLPQPVDFDEDGLLEVIVNQRERGSVSDTLRFFEWGGTDFLPADTLLVSVIPRDLGDSDGDGLQNLLTQIAAATLLLEQPSERAIPSQLAFIDTTGLDGDSITTNDLIGAQLTDIDRDGRGEIAGHNGDEWRFLEFADTTYVEAFRLENPTSPASVDSAALANAFGPAIAADGDFDGDGRTDFLVGDRDGDLIVYETVMDDSMRVAWTDESDFIDAGDRMATGDVDGDGQTDFVTFRQNYPLTLDGGEQEPSLGVYEVWGAAGDDNYAVRGTFPIAGEVAPDGGIETFDYDGDGRDEIAISHPPELFIADFDDTGTWRVVFYDDGTSAGGKVLSASMVPGDFNENGTPELLVSTSAEVMQRYEYDAAAAQRPPPSWVAAQPLDASRIRLQWTAPGADSVTVFDAPEGTALSPATATTDSSVVLSRTSPRSTALRAWYGTEPSPLSTRRDVRPHAPATVEEVRAASPTTVEVVFTERLDPGTRAAQFALANATPSTPAGLTFGADNRALVLRFASRPSPASAVLSWENVQDDSGLPVGQTDVVVSFPKQNETGFLVSDWTILDQRRVEIFFSAPLAPASAQRAEHYTLEADAGRIADVRFDESVPNRVVVEVDGTVIGATGRQVLLRLGDISSAAGTVLDEKSRGLRLTEPATGLDDVFVYPNPYRASRHGDRLTIAGLPPETTVRILSADGRLVRVLPSERSISGGRAWDLRDARGNKVPSGIYIFRVESPSDDAVIRRAAVIR